MICVSLRPQTAEQAVRELHESKAAGADLAEIRGDLLREPAELLDILPKKPLPVLVTVRPHWEGGRWTGPEEDRVRLLKAACAAGADYVDVEFKAYKDFPRAAAKLVLSFHDFEKTPDDLEKMVAKMRGLEPDLLKVAVQASGAADLLRCVRLQKELGVPGAVIAMGEFGEPLRILSPRYGGFLTYAALRAGAETAAGQAPVADLVQLYRAKTIDDETQVYAVLGDPVAHSKGPLLFNTVFRDLGMNARYVRVRLDDGKLLREAIETLEIRGASVTIPHKEAARAAADSVDEASEGIGAVNTLVMSEGRLAGANTDAPGALEAIRDGAVRKWKHGIYGLRALVLGAGGAARAIAWGLIQEGARVTIANRTFDRAKSLAEELRCDFLARDRLIEARAQIVANATSVGMGGDVSPYPAELWKRDVLAFDAVYTPRFTRFLRDAKLAGAEIVDGVDFFLRQANRQVKLFTGRTIPTEVLKELNKRF